MPTVADITGYLDGFAPSSLAADWDNVGLLLGDLATPVQRLMTCLTITAEVVAEAIQARVHFLVTHHPIFFRPVHRLTSASPEGRMLLCLCRQGIAVYSPHTAFDNTPGGINDLLARKLGLREVAPLRFLEEPRQCKVVVFVPEQDLAAVADAMFAAGAGHIGEYSQCSFRLAGTGTFFGSEAASPTIGQKDRREQVSEWRLEALCPEAAVQGVITAMRRSHSYEEPAYDVYPLRPSPAKSGIGRIGQLPGATPLAQLAQILKSALKSTLVQIVGDPARPIQRLAIVCGSGGDLLQDALKARVDAFLTGEMRFHDFLAARSHNLALLLPGHYASERCGIEELAFQLQEKWPELEVWASRQESDPVSGIF